MTIINRSIGMVLLVLMTGQTNFSCIKKNLKETYTLLIANHYFESIDSVFLAGRLITQPILPYHNLEWGIIRRGDYTIRFYTQSDLVISAKLNIATEKNTLTIILNRNGSVIIK